MLASKAAHEKQEKQKREAEKLRIEKVEKEAGLRALEEAEVEQTRRKKEQGWTGRDLGLLWVLKKLTGRLEMEVTMIRSIFVRARLFHQHSIFSLSSPDDKQIEISPARRKLRARVGFITV